MVWPNHIKKLDLKYLYSKKGILNTIIVTNNKMVRKLNGLL